LNRFDYFKQTFCSTQLLISRVKPEPLEHATAGRIDAVLFAGRDSACAACYQLRFPLTAMTIAHGIVRNLTPAPANHWPEFTALTDEEKAWISI
jgi:hypothetical protein